MEYQANTPDTTDGTGENDGDLSVSQATDKLAGLLTDSIDAAPDEAEGEATLDENPKTDAPDDNDEIGGHDDGGDSDEAELEAEHDDAEDAEPDEIEDREPEDIEIDGEKVTLDDIRKSYLRQSDYTRKTQELAEQRKAFEQEFAQIAAEREHVKQVIDAFEAQNEQQVDLEKLAQLAEEDPFEYTRVKALLDSQSAIREAAKAERQRIQDIEEKTLQEQYGMYLQEQQNALLESLPEMRGEKSAEYALNIKAYMEGIGYSSDEIAHLYDHRAVVLADKARKYDQLMAKRSVVEKKVRNAPKVTKPGKSKSSAENSASVYDSTMAKLRKTGTVEDAVNALLAS